MLGATQPRRTLGHSPENACQVKRRAADNLEDFARGGLLLEGVVQRTVKPLALARQPFVLYLQPCVEPAKGGGGIKRRPTPQTELRLGWVLLLTPGTRHAGSLPAAGAAEGRNRGPRLTASVSRGQGRGHTRGRGAARPRHLSSVVRCPPRRQRGRYSDCMTP